MPRRRRFRSTQLKKAVGRGASSEAVPGAAMLDTILGKVKATGVSSLEGIEHQTVNAINLSRHHVMSQKAARTWVLLLAADAGCSFGAGWTSVPTRKHMVKEEKMQQGKK